MIIGVSGRAGSGKDTFAALLVEEGEKLGLHVRRAAFATGVKEATVALLGGKYTINDMNDREKKDSVRVGSKLLREIMQEVGAYGREIDKNFWIDRLFNEFMWVHSRGDLLVITDVRYQDEAERVHEESASIATDGPTVVVEITRKDAGLCGKAALHPSEAGLAPDLVDYEIDNDGSVEDLRQHAHALLMILMLEK